MNFDTLIDDAFNHINSVRSKPQQLLHTYAPLINNYDGKIYKDKIRTREGVNALHDLLDDLTTRKGNSDALKWCFGLHMIADQQARRLGQNGWLTTEGQPNHTSLPDRAKEYAIITGKVSEVCEFGGHSGQEVVEWLLIDDGLSSRKRRKTLLDPSFHYIGIASSLHSSQQVVTVIILAEQVTSLVAPGKDGYYFKRQPLEQNQLQNFVTTSVRKNQKDIIQKSAYTGKAISNSVVPALVPLDPKKTQSLFYG